MFLYVRHLCVTTIFIILKHLKWINSNEYIFSSLTLYTFKTCSNPIMFSISGNIHTFDIGMDICTCLYFFRRKYLKIFDLSIYLSIFFLDYLSPTYLSLSLFLSLSLSLSLLLVSFPLSLLLISFSLSLSLSLSPTQFLLLSLLRIARLG